MTEIEYHTKLVSLQPGLMRIARSLTKDTDEAKDLVQETVLKSLQFRNKFLPDSNLEGWTYTILKNTFINNYRRSLRHKTLNVIKKEGVPQSYPYSSVTDNPESIYSSRELEKAIDKLDDNVKLPFKMHYEGYKYKEIAKSLKLNLGTVKSKIFFARKKLMKQLIEFV